MEPGADIQKYPGAGPFTREAAIAYLQDNPRAVRWEMSEHFQVEESKVHLSCQAWGGMDALRAEALAAKASAAEPEPAAEAAQAARRTPRLNPGSPEQTKEAVMEMLRRGRETTAAQITAHLGMGVSTLYAHLARWGGLRGLRKMLEKDGTPAPVQPAPQEAEKPPFVPVAGAAAAADTPTAAEVADPLQALLRALLREHFEAHTAMLTARRQSIEAGQALSAAMQAEAAARRLLALEMGRQGVEQLPLPGGGQLRLKLELQYEGEGVPA